MNAQSLFSYTENNRFAPDWVSLATCYQPIAGSDALMVYHSLLAAYDNGRETFPLYSLSGQVELSFESIVRSLDILSALSLLDIYQEGERYQFVLYPPLSIAGFLGNALYKSLLTQSIGEPAVERMQAALPHPRGQKVSKTFSQVFDNLGQIEPVQATQTNFEMAHFQQQMGRENLRFAEKETDTIALHRLAEQHSLTWYELFQVAKETAIGHLLSIKRMEQQLATQATGGQELTSQEKVLLSECTRRKPLELLTLLKQTKKAALLQSERLCLQQLAELGLLDEVINVLIVYTFSKVDSANLNEKYILKVANDLSYKGIATAEQAIVALREGAKKTKKASAPKQDNTPEWSKKEVQTEPTREEQEQLEALRRRMQEQEEKGGAR